MKCFSLSDEQINPQINPHGRFKGPNCFDMLWLEVFGIRSDCRGACRLTILKVCKGLFRSCSKFVIWRSGHLLFQLCWNCGILLVDLSNSCVSPLHLFMIYALQLTYVVRGTPRQKQAFVFFWLILEVLGDVKYCLLFFFNNFFTVYSVNAWTCMLFMFATTFPLIDTVDIF